ncbi:hypothetical protein BJY00DRAFT_286874 [Aspergillus carlsbadensis]|nr:hypothetical protein BJY00DRAFT_286874 [Aspergillus carlsbadensis]
MIKLSRMSKKQRKRLADLSASLPPELILRFCSFLDRKTLCSCVHVCRRYNVLLIPLLYDNALIYKDIWIKRETSEELGYSYPDVPIPKPGRGYADCVFNKEPCAVELGRALGVLVHEAAGDGHVPVSRVLH